MVRPAAREAGLAVRAGEQYPSVDAGLTGSDWALVVATVAGGVAAAFAIGQTARGLWRRSIGRRWNHYRRIERLAVNAQVTYFTAVIGFPPAIRRSLEDPDDHDECIWIDQDYYVQAVVDSDETVVMWAITTRDKRFRPTFTRGESYRERGWLFKRLGRPYRVVHDFRCRLLSTTFAELREWPPQEGMVFRGAHSFGYFEAHYLGLSGHYLNFLFALNESGATGWGTDVWRLFDDNELGREEWSAPDELERIAGLAGFRSHARPNTYGEASWDLKPHHHDVPVGPALYTVAPLP